MASNLGRPAAPSSMTRARIQILSSGEEASSALAYVAPSVKPAPSNHVGARASQHPGLLALARTRVLYSASSATPSRPEARRVLWMMRTGKGGEYGS